ncbi:MAG: hypothetical protein CSA86_02910 [Arcobacter sp.]|nr:MAG: hypothetical protein CSA86_02910 [Arcobacter sp.]
MKKFLISSVVASSVLFGNNVVEINVNKDTLKVGADLYLNRYYNVNNSSNYYVTFDYLRKEEEDKEAQSIKSMGLKMINPYTDDHGLSLGLGIKSVYTDVIDSKTFVALPLTMHGRLEINEVIYLDIDVSYSPKVLSFSDANRYTDMQFRANYRVLTNGYVFVGARRIDTKYEDIDETKFDSSVFFGLEARF